MSEQYIVSARKYRPDSFASIVGQGALASTLRTAVLQGRTAHAYLFCGPRGVGKTTAARVLAKAINCMNPTSDGEACNVCESCRAFSESRSFNIFELDAASNNSVEDIRSLTEQVAIAPVLGKYKVYIIDEVHMLSQAAFNAFLKTLEEPPSYAIFILATTEKHKILPTILSRCQTYDFKRITVSDIAKHLSYVAESEGIATDPTALALIAEKADGGMRDALSMFDRVAVYGEGQIRYQDALDCLNILDHAYYIRFIRSFVSGDYQEVLLTLHEVLTRGFDGQLVMAGLASFARDLLVLKHEHTAHLLEKPEVVLGLYEETSHLVAPSALHQIIRLLVEADGKYRTASNKRLLIELTLLNILTAFQPSALGDGGAQVVLPKATNEHQPSQRTSSPVEQSTPAPSPITKAQKALEVEEQDKPKEGKPQTADISTVPIRSQRQEQIRKVRSQFRQRNRTSEVEDAPSIPTEEAHEAYTEEDVQAKWFRFVEEHIGTEQIILRNTLSNTFPKLAQEHMIEVAVANTGAVIEPLQAILPQIQQYMQRELRNTDIRIQLVPMNLEQSHIPTTNREKYEALCKAYPFLETVREHFNLRII